MLKYLPLIFLSVIFYSLTIRTQTELAYFIELGELNSAKQTTDQMWLFATITAVLFLTAIVLALLDIRKVK